MKKQASCAKGTSRISTQEHKKTLIFYEFFQPSKPVKKSLISKIQIYRLRNGRKKVFPKNAKLR